MRNTKYEIRTVPRDALSGLPGHGSYFVFRICSLIFLPMRSRLPLRRLTAIAILLLFTAWLAVVAAVVARGKEDQARQARRADAIVVLGAAQYVGRPSPVL